MSRTGPSVLAIPVTAFVSLVWVAIGCGLAGGNASPHATTQVQPSALASPLPSPAAPTVLPTASIVASPDATAQPTNSPPATPTASSTSRASTPPDGLLTAAALVVQGKLGTYCWSHGSQTDCVDAAEFSAPTLPNVHIDSSVEELSFAMTPPEPFTEWHAFYGKDGAAAIELGGVTAPDPDSTASPGPTFTDATFAVPPTGSWIVSVRVTFADGGDADYGWAVTVT